MAEYVLKDKVKKMNLESKFIIVSRATSYEEDGNDMHYGTKRMLEINGILFDKHRATRLQKDDYNRYDYFICMDEANIRNTLNIFDNNEKHKVFKLLKNRDVKDPWYTGNFEETYDDIDEGTNRLLDMLKVDFD